MKASRLREMTDEELKQAGDEARRELLDLRLKKGYSDAAQPMRVRTLRREVARIRTVIRERERESHV